jgi:hypothetical protein
LLNAADSRREIRAFDVVLTRPLGAKNGRTKGSFVGDTRQQVIDFYAEVVQNLTPWQAKAPKLPPPPQEVPETPQAEPPLFVAAGEREIGEARLGRLGARTRLIGPRPSSRSCSVAHSWPNV